MRPRGSDGGEGCTQDVEGACRGARRGVRLGTGHLDSAASSAQRGAARPVHVAQRGGRAASQRDRPAQEPAGPTGDPARLGWCGGRSSLGPIPEEDEEAARAQAPPQAGATGEDRDQPFGSDSGVYLGLRLLLTCARRAHEQHFVGLAYEGAGGQDRELGSIGCGLEAPVEALEGLCLGRRRRAAGRTRPPSRSWPDSLSLLLVPSTLVFRRFMAANVQRPCPCLRELR